MATGRNALQAKYSYNIEGLSCKIRTKIGCVPGQAQIGNETNSLTESGCNREPCQVQSDHMCFITGLGHKLRNFV